MTHIKPTPEAEKLTAPMTPEVEARIRAQIDMSIMPDAWPCLLVRMLDHERYRLDAARAETETWHHRAYNAQVENYELRSLAAELVEGLEEARDEIAELSNVLSREPDIARIVSLIGQAHAQGIGGEREKVESDANLPSIDDVFGILKGF